MNMFINYLNSKINEQTTALYAKPQAQSLLRKAAAKQPNRPFFAKPAAIEADTLEHPAKPVDSSTSAMTPPVAGPKKSSVKAGLAALSLAAAKVGTFTAQLATGAGAKLSASFGSGYASLVKGLSTVFASKKAPSKDFGLPTLPKMASLEDMVDFSKFGL